MLNCEPQRSGIPREPKSSKIQKSASCNNKKRKQSQFELCLCLNEKQFPGNASRSVEIAQISLI